MIAGLRTDMTSQAASVAREAEIIDLQGFFADDLQTVTPEVAGSSPVAPAPQGTATRRICPHGSRGAGVRRPAATLASPFGRDEVSVLGGSTVVTRCERVKD